MKNALLISLSLILSAPAFAATMRLQMTILSSVGDECQSSIDLLSGGPLRDGLKAVGIQWTSCTTEYQSAEKLAKAPEKIFFYQESGSTQLTVNGRALKAVRALLYAPDSLGQSEVVWARDEYYPDDHMILSKYDRGLKDQACLAGQAAYHYKSRDDGRARELTALIGNFKETETQKQYPVFILSGSMKSGKIKFTTMCREQKPLKN